MPFKVKFRIYVPAYKAPVFETLDKTLARVEYNDLFNKNPWARLEFDIIPVDLTKSEEYVWLVYRVRKAIHKYFNQGRKKEDLVASTALEKELDQWNTRTRFYLNGHPNCQIGDEKAHAFFLLVEKWRELWHRYFACKKAKSEPDNIINEMKKQCFDYEAQIDKYIKQTIGLL